MGCCGPDVKAPDYGAANAEAVYTDLELLPFRRAVEAASRTGTPLTWDGKTIDFTGSGDADVAGQYADQMAAAMLALQQKYGSQYVAQRLKELQAADPEGTAARKALYDKVQASVAQASNYTNPTAQALQDATLGEVEKGASLSPDVTREVQQGVRGAQASRGNVLGNAPAYQEAAAVTGYGEQRAGERQQEGLAYLESGVSPDDVMYRRVQTALGNLGSFISGDTPESNFASISSAGRGAAPFLSTGGVSTGVNANAGAQGAQNALDIYRTNINWTSQQTNPYLAGIGTGARVYGLASAMKPSTSKGIVSAFDQRGNVAGGVG